MMHEITKKLNEKFDGSFIRTVSTLGGCTVIAFVLMYFLMDIMKADRKFYRIEYTKTVETQTLATVELNKTLTGMRVDAGKRDVLLTRVADELDDVADATVHLRKAQYPEYKRNKK